MITRSRAVRASDRRRFGRLPAGLLALALASTLAACGSDDTQERLSAQEALIDRQEQRLTEQEQRLTEQEQRLMELEAALEAATSTSATTVPQAYVDAKAACEAYSEELIGIRRDAFTLEAERSRWIVRWNDYVAGDAPDYDTVKEAAIASLRASDLARLNEGVERIRVGSPFRDYAQSLLFYTAALAHESSIQSRFALLDFGSELTRLVEQANVAMEEWKEYRTRIVEGSLPNAKSDCLEAAELLNP